jgi:hypothetical protein
MVGKGKREEEEEGKEGREKRDEEDVDVEQEGREEVVMEGFGRRGDESES